MNILYHHRTRGQGVEGIHIIGIVNGLRNLGHNVTIIGPPGTNPENYPYGRHRKKYGDSETVWLLISRHLPETLFEILEIMYNIYSYLKLKTLLRAKQIDFIYERYALFEFGGVFASITNKVPIILEVNDSSLVERVRPLRS